MQFCNFCAKNSEQVKQINNNKVTIANNAFQITNLLNIFQNDIVQFLLDNKNTLICLNCLKQLKKCYEFVLQIKESENKLILGEEIKTEHDYFEILTNTKNEGNETHNTKVTVNSEHSENYVNLQEINSNLKFRTILPKISNAEVSNKKVEKSNEIKSRFYKCLQCKESFKSFKHLSEHEKEFCENRTAKDLQICQYCHKCFANEIVLNDHRSLKHAQGEFKCCLCEDKQFTAKGYLVRHLEKVHNQESLQYFCGICPEMVCLSKQDEIREHFLQNHASTIISDAKEQQPPNSTLSEDDMDLEMHEEFLDEFLLAHTNENSFQFSECWEALDLHLPDMLQSAGTNLNQVAEFSKSFSCPKCFEQFKYPQPLLKHLAEIHDLPVLICRVCQKCFASFKDFKKHKLQKCQNNSKLPLTLKCPYCSKSFKSTNHLKQHLRIVHCQIKRHICQLCDKQFSTLDHLKKHVLSQHQNDRKHVCMVCDKSFTQLGHLKQHLAIHTTGKTVQCGECSLKFWRKIDLERHRLKNHVGGAEGVAGK